MPFAFWKQHSSAINAYNSSSFMNSMKFVFVALIVCSSVYLRAQSVEYVAWSPELSAKLEAAEANVTPFKFAVVESDEAIISATMSPVSIQAGLDVMRDGGNAADAAITVATTQVTRALGSYVSFAGIAQILYYDAKTGKTTSIDGGWKSFRAENEPKSIPGFNSMDKEQGRKVLVPGFMAAMGELHRRFGVLPRNRILAPSIFFAENGVPISAMLHGFFNMRQSVFERTSEGRKFVFHDGADMPQLGAKFIQRELADVLRRVEINGFQEFYSGQWAKHFVDVVKREGGKVSEEDLKTYSADVQEPLHTDYLGFDVFLPGERSLGGQQLALALRAYP